MFTGPVKNAFRFLRKHKRYTIVNILGMALSFICALFIGLYIWDELSYDRHFDNADRIYRVIETQMAGDGHSVRTADVAYRIASLDRELTSLESGTNITNIGRANISTGDNDERFPEPFQVSDQKFLEMLSPGVLFGSLAGALTEPHTVVVTRSLAERMYGQINVVDKLLYSDRSDQPFRITAVLKDFPENSHLDAELIASIETYAKLPAFQKAQGNDWSSHGFTTYFLVQPGTNISNLESEIIRTVNARRPEKESHSNFSLQPLTDIHFHSANIQGGYNSRPGDITFLYIFGAVGIFILIISVVNYTNLSTSLATTRHKEIGIKKTIGATRHSLSIQFIGEAIAVSLFATLAGFAAASMLIAPYNQLTGKELTTTQLTTPGVILGSLLLALLTGILSGIYPSLYLSRLRPSWAIKGTAAGRNRGGFRKTLVTFQFTLSIMLIFGTIIAWRQMHYVQTKDLGFSKDQLLAIDINSGRVRNGFQAIKNELNRMPDVSNVSVSTRVPGEWKDIPEVSITKPGSTEPVRFHFFSADEDFLPTFGINLADGRNFEGRTDSLSFLINETASRQLGLTEPVGSILQIKSVDADADPDEKPFEGHVIGIVKDFYFQSLHQEITPMVVVYKNNSLQPIDYFTVRLKPGDWQADIGKMKKIFQEIDPSQSLEYNFIDEKIDNFYRQDRKRSQIFSLGGIISIGLACLGLFTLSSFTIQRRTKEIGIRKVLGATAQQITLMLSMGYLRLVMIGFIVAMPLGIWALSRWLNSFAYHVSIGWLSVLLTFALTLIIAVATVAFESIKMGISNPAESIRTE